MSGSVARMSQLYQDWDAFLGQWFGPLVGPGHYRTFEFDQDHPGVMRMETLPSDTNPTEVTMLRAGVAIKDIRLIRAK